MPPVEAKSHPEGVRLQGGMTMFVQWPLAKTFPATTRGIVASKNPVASEVGVQMLRRSGTAVDAAVAASFASTIVEPFMSGIGGGGLAVYQPAGSAPRAFNFGMKAPASCTPDMYEVLPGLYDADLFGWPSTRNAANVSGPRSMALPGLVPGLHGLWKLGGMLPWEDLVSPSIKLAREGCPADWMLTLRTTEGYDLLSRFPSSSKVYLPKGRPPLPDLGVSAAEAVQNRNLANTLEAISSDPAALGKGVIAQSLVDASEGRMTAEEITSQQPKEAPALQISFGRLSRNLEVHLVPWATGGPTVLEWLGIVQELDPPANEHDARFWSSIVRAGDVALQDRLRRLADPDFSPFPWEVLDAQYHRRMAEAIRANEVPAFFVLPSTGSTTHLAAVDEAGTAITLTQTLLSPWGSGVVAEASGVLMNNGMMWFNPEPGSANSIEGGKMALANMCPVLVTEDGRPYLAYGASGGRRILAAVVQILMRVVHLGQSLAEAMAAPRLEITGREIRADIRLGQPFCDTLSRLLDRPVRLRPPVLGASPWASPVGLGRNDDGSWSGGADPYTLACVLEA